MAQRMSGLFWAVRAMSKIILSIFQPEIIGRLRCGRLTVSVKPGRFGGCRRMRLTSWTFPWLAGLKTATGHFMPMIRFAGSPSGFGFCGCARVICRQGGSRRCPQTVGALGKQIGRWILREPDFYAAAPGKTATIFRLMPGGLKLCVNPAL